MIIVIGLGFVGLTTALGFSEKGFKVYGYDIDRKKCEDIRNGKIPFFEPEIENTLKKQINKNFKVINNLKEGIDDCQIIFYCVGTPSDEKGKADLKYVYSAIEETLKVIRKDDFKVLAIKSTVPPSTTENIKPFIESLGFKVGIDVGLANNPEFLREGCAWSDFINPDRIVVGCDDKKSEKILQEIYTPFNAPIYKVSLNTAEFIKYLSNSLLSTLISFSNEMSMIAYSIKNINIPEAFKILHLDRRWSGTPANMTSYVYPGCGFGGYCLPKDTLALYTISKDKGFEPVILKNVLNTNVKIRDFLLNHIENEIPKNNRIGILGLSFKPNSDDIRETPAKEMIARLLSKGYRNIMAYDPMANNIFRLNHNFPISYASSLNEIAENADTFICLTAWKEFKLNKFLFKNKKIYDFRYFLEGQ